jgi:hypothetical protein
MFGKKGTVKLDPALLERARAAAGKAGYPDVTEFLSHLIEKELRKLEEAVDGAKDEAELRERLKGLGYIS